MFITDFYWVLNDQNSTLSLLCKYCTQIRTKIMQKFIVQKLFALFLHDFCMKLFVRMIFAWKSFVYECHTKMMLIIFAWYLQILHQKTHETWIIFESNFHKGYTTWTTSWWCTWLSHPRSSHYLIERVVVY